MFWIKKYYWFSKCAMSIKILLYLSFSCLSFGITFPVEFLEKGELRDSVTREKIKKLNVVLGKIKPAENEKGVVIRRIWICGPSGAWCIQMSQSSTNRSVLRVNHKGEKIKKNLADSDLKNLEKNLDVILSVPNTKKTDKGLYFDVPAIFLEKISEGKRDTAMRSLNKSSFDSYSYASRIVGTIHRYLDK